MSPNTTERGTDPVAKVCWGAKDAGKAPGVGVFGSTGSRLMTKKETTRTGLPSPLTTPNATAKGADPVVMTWWVAKDNVDAPGVVVVISSDTLASPPKLATTRSGLPSPLTSPNATEIGTVPPVAKVCWGA